MKVAQSGFLKKSLLNNLTTEGSSISRNLLNANASTQAVGSALLDTICPEDKLLGGASSRSGHEDVFRQRHVLVNFYIT